MHDILNSPYFFLFLGLGVGLIASFIMQRQRWKQRKQERQQRRHVPQQHKRRR